MTYGRVVGDVDAEVLLDIGARHAEGPLWDAASARLWWVDIVGERVHELDPRSGADQSWPTGGQPGGVIVRADGVPVIQAPDGLRTLDRATGRTDLTVGVELDRPENRGNDLKVDSRGVVWAGTMAYDKRAGNAALYRIVGDSVSTMVDALTISNGPAIDERNGRMYLADTALGIVDVFDHDLDAGEIGDRRRFLDVSDRGWWPDGMTVDVDGGFWVALGRSGAVHRYRPDGSLDAVVELPTTHPTSVTFGGPDGDELFITTSWFDVPADDRAAEPLAGAIFRCRPGVGGTPSPRWPGADRR